MSAGEASILHNAWLGCEGDWLLLWRGNSPEKIDAAWTSLEAKELARSRVATTEGLSLRQHGEDETDRLTTPPWQILGRSKSIRFADAFEPPWVRLLARVDQTAGPN